MVWQDIVIALTNFVFAFSLFSQVYHGFKEKKGFVILKNSGPTSLGLLAMTICFFTLKLYFSAIMTCITFSLWTTLFVQRLIYPNAK
ncbi:MAG: hypothetical protein AB7V77_05550 [Candidatus Woesearchaeota archaeon]